MDELISVIVPVYKAEKYLDQCISSIVNQTYKNIELILVDDGSPDRCSYICDVWGKKDKRIKVIHQQNSGGGQARNNALAIARGEMIAFVDSDDYIAPIMFEFLHDQFHDGVDIVECNFCEVHDGNALFDSKNDPFEAQVFTAEEAMIENIEDHIFRQLIWNKMYRKSVIKNVRFPIGKKIDDEFWTYQVLGNARKLIHTNKTLYAYRQQDNSVMHLLSTDKRLEAIEAKIQRHEYICKNMPALETKSLYNLWFTCIYQGQLILKANKKDTDHNLWNRLEKTLRRYPIKRNLKDVPIIKKMWLTIASNSFYLVCKWRNALNIGI